MAKQPITSTDLHKKLKKLRQEREWSQGQLAEKINIDVRVISRYEKGMVWPSTQNILKLAKAFQVSIDYLLGNVSESNNRTIKNEKLSKQIEEIKLLPKEDQEILSDLLDAYIKRRKLES